MPNKKPIPEKLKVAGGAAMPLVSAAGATYMFSWGTRDTTGNGLWIFLGAGVLTLLSIVWQVVTKIREHARGLTVEDAKSHLAISFTDELRPLAVAISDVSRMPSTDRAHATKRAAQVAATALRALVDEHSHRSRANIFSLNPKEQQIDAIANVGRGKKPRPFIRGNARGDAALKFIEDTKPILYEDLSKECPQGFKLSDHDYQTFVSVPIWTDTGVYGMVTIDAPEAGSLTDMDVKLATLVAEMMAAAFEASQDQDIPTPTAE